MPMPLVSKWLRMMNCSICAMPMVQCASMISLVRALIMEGLAMKAGLPGQHFGSEHGEDGLQNRLRIRQ